MAYSPLLASVLLVSCGQMLVSHSQPTLFPVDRTVRRKKGASQARPTRPLFCAGCYRFQYKLKAILMPCATEEWSGHARLQSVLHGFLLFWVHYFSDFSIGCNNGKMMTMAKTMVQLQLGDESCILLESTCTTTWVTTRVKQSIWSHRLITCPSKNFEEIIFVVEVKSTKAVKFIGLKNFALCGINVLLWYNWRQCHEHSKPTGVLLTHSHYLYFT